MATKKLFKISITGKANSGKNTVAKLLREKIINENDWIENPSRYEFIAFADPIKKMIKIMFPDLPRKFLNGPSKYRAKPIPGAFKDGKPLTIRQLLIDLGTKVGRAANDNIWLNVFDKTYEKALKNNDIIIVTDTRFRNEFDHLKNKGFIAIKIVRDDYTKILDISETSQDAINDSEYDFIIYNNGTLEELKVNIDNLKLF